MLFLQPDGVDSTNLGPEEQEEFQSRFQDQIKTTLRQRVYAWQPIEYDYHKSMVYMVGRSAVEYAVMHRIFSEMNQRIPGFAPKTLFDFGSGMGTVTW